MALPTTPEWLSKREGSLKPGLRDFTLLVLLNNQPQYRLDVRPAVGQFTCNVTQTINGKQLDDSLTRYSSPDAAFEGGLDTLRSQLGW